MANAALLNSMGHHVEEHRLGVTRAAWWEYNKLNAVETAADFARLAAIVGRPVAAEDLSPLNAALLAYGQGLPGVELAAAIRAVRKASQLIAQDLDRFDVFLTPSLTQPARPVGYWSMEDGDRERYLLRWSDAAYMFAFNLSGLPAISVPAAMDARGVPIGVQLVGRYGDEACYSGWPARSSWLALGQTGARLSALESYRRCPTIAAGGRSARRAHCNVR